MTGEPDGHVDEVYSPVSTSVISVDTQHMPVSSDSSKDPLSHPSVLLLCLTQISSGSPVTYTRTKCELQKTLEIRKP